MNSPIDAQAAIAPSDPLAASTGSADAWQRRFGVPWERVERAVRAVSDRAVAASRRKFAALDSVPARSEAQPG